MTAVKVDLKKELKKFYNPEPVPEIIEVPEFQFLMIDGMGNVASEAFQKAIEALFSASYKIKFMVKNHLDYDYGVMPLEGLWWADDMNDFVAGNKDRWKWTLMIMQPDKVNKDLVEQAIKEVSLKKKIDCSGLRFEKFKEGKAAQMMHIGPFSEEHANIMKLHKLIDAQKGTFDGKLQKHHEIYLSDFRKVDPAKMKTVLRQPFVKF